MTYYNVDFTLNIIHYILQFNLSRTSKIIIHNKIYILSILEDLTTCAINFMEILILLIKNVRKVFLEITSFLIEH